MTDKPVITEIIGIDDWLIFGQDAQGVVYYTICETWSVWLDTPCKGQADYGSPEDAADWRYVIEWCKRNKSDLYWESNILTVTMSESEMSGIRRNLVKVMNTPCNGCSDPVCGYATNWGESR